MLDAVVKHDGMDGFLVRSRIPTARLIDTCIRYSVGDSFMIPFILGHFYLGQVIGFSYRVEFQRGWVIGGGLAAKFPS